jgi:hypothetical protein
MPQPRSEPTRWQRLLIWLHWRLRRCSYCHWRTSVWSYMPGHHEACDQCVPRGCSCNMEPVDGDYENADPANWAEPLDEQGRKSPCCEWFPKHTAW